MDNTLVWADIPTRDLERAMDFYSALLDVQVTPSRKETMRFAMLPRRQQRGGLSRPMDNITSPAVPVPHLSLPR